MCAVPGPGRLSRGLPGGLGPQWPCPNRVLSESSRPRPGRTSPGGGGAGRARAQAAAEAGAQDAGAVAAKPELDKQAGAARRSPQPRRLCSPAGRAPAAEWGLAPSPQAPGCTVGTWHPRGGTRVGVGRDAGGRCGRGAVGLRMAVTGRERASLGAGRCSPPHPRKRRCRGSCWGARGRGTSRHARRALLGLISHCNATWLLGGLVQPPGPLTPGGDTGLSL